MRRSGDLSRSAAVRHAGDLGDMDGRRAAAPPDDIEQSLPQIAVDRLGHPLRRLVVAAEAVREPGIRMRRHGAFGHGGEPGHVRLHLLGPEAAIESDRQQARMRDGRIESLDRLPRKRASARIGNRPRNHDRDRNAALGAQPLDRKQGRLRVQRVEHGLDEQDVGPAVDEAPRLLVIGFGELVESHRPVARIVHVGRDGGRPVRRAHRAGDEAGLRRIAQREAVGLAAGQRGGGPVDLVHVLLQRVIGHRHGVRIERIGRYDVGPRLQIGLMNAADRLGLGQHEQVVTPLEQHLRAGEALAPIILLSEAVALYHRPQPAVQHQDAARELIVYRKFQHAR